VYSSWSVLRECSRLIKDLTTVDYVDPIYSKLALEAQRRIEQDPDLSRILFKQGMSFICDGTPSRFTETWKSQAEASKRRCSDGTFELMDTPEEVFQRIHGPGSVPQTEMKLGHKPRWNLGYCNLNNSFIDAAESVRIYYERCVAAGVVFECGMPVDRLEISDAIATGVILEDGRVLKANQTVVAAGAWSPKLIDVEGRSRSSAHEVAWIKVTPEEELKWKGMSITTNLSTGLNVFPPYRGEVKILRRSPGYINTVSVPHPEDRSRVVQMSLPRTTVTNPGDVIPADAEAELRSDLREIMPPLAERPFERTRLCW
jgi:sarcosine oxidase/L-pipecolate oxidase